MRSRAGVRLAVASAACVLIALVVLVADQRRLAFTLGVPAEAGAVTLERDQQVCQGPIDVSTDAKFVRLSVGAPRSSGPPLDIQTRSASDDLVLGRARIGAGYGDRSVKQVMITGVTRGRRIRVCVRNRGAMRVVLFGDAGGTLSASTAFVDGRPVAADVAVEFLRGSPRSLMSLLPTIFERASLFKAGFVGPWLFWLLSVLVALGLPVCLWRALLACER